MQRICFTLNVRPEHLDEYRIAHRAVWPEMQEALRSTGWHNYSLFLSPEGLLVGYVECEDFEACRLAMQALDVNKRWQDAMAPFFVDQTHPDQAAKPLEEVFHLD